MNIALFVNAALALVSAGFGVLALLRPRVLTRQLSPFEHDVSPSTTSTATQFYSWMYASRAIPLGVAVAAVAATATFEAADRSTTAVWLVVAAVAQLGDVAIGLRYRVLGMMAAPAVVAGVHLATAFLLLT